MLSFTADPRHGFLEITVDGRIDKAHYQQVVDAVDGLLKTHKQINVVEIVRDLGWVEPEVWWKDMVFHMTHRDFVHRVAVVSDSGWVGPVTRMFAPFYPAAVRVFAESELQAARRWAKEPAPSGKRARDDEVDRHARDFA